MFVDFFIVSLWNFVLLKYANLGGALQATKITNREKRKRQIPRKKQPAKKTRFTICARVPGMLPQVALVNWEVCMRLGGKRGGRILKKLLFLIISEIK